MGNKIVKQVSCEALESRRLLNAGDQDLSYGDNGMLERRFGDHEYQFLPGSNPNGSATVVSMSGTGRSFALRKFNAGVPDTSAGADGIIARVALPFTTATGKRPSPAQIWTLSGGRTLIEFVIPTDRRTSDDGYFVRLKSDNTLDTSYGNGGAVFFGGRFYLETAQQGDKLIALTGGVPGRAVARFTDDGKQDATFGTDGIATPRIEPYPRNLLVQPDGKILVSASFGSTPKVYRLTVDGQLDTTFGGGDGKGVGAFVDALRGMAFDSAGRILLSGTNGLTRLNADGLLDLTFGTNGQATPFANFSINNLEGEVVVSDGTQIMPFGGRSFFRIDTSGKYDSDFGIVNVRLFELAPALDSDIGNATQWNAQTVATQPDGSVLIWRRFADGKFVQVKIEGSGTTPGPVRLNAGVVGVTGTTADDVIHFEPKFFWTTAMLNSVGRTFQPGEITMLQASAGAGNDVINVDAVGDKWPASLTGGDGNDRIVSGDGNDSLSGNGGNDTLDGGEGNDRVAGNGGRDKLFGGFGNDRIYGGESGDWLYGGLGDDQLNGEGGDDRLYGDDGGVDTLHGNAGDDLLVTRDDGIDYLFGDGGRDSGFVDKNDVLTSIETVI